MKSHPDTSRTLTISSISVAMLIGLSMTAVPASATTVNNDIKVGKGELKRKCQRSGGKFKVYGDGSYGCIINRSDGSLTTVGCTTKNDCTGTHDNKKKVRNHSKRWPRTTAGRLKVKRMQVR